jgi:CHAT domain-containing protein/pimeloyl-ACP methyl ester carboxylesterase
MAAKKAASKKRVRTAVPRVATREELAATATWQAAFSLPNETVEADLRTGEDAGLLEDYFGPERYAELRQLSQEAASRRVRGGPRVLILPGIVGSTLGIPRPGIIPDDVYWFDPIDIGRGFLRDLALPKGKNIVALGVILFAYLKLKLELQIDGYDADFFPYDWRDNISASAKRLLAQLEKEKASQVNIVAHSMGGLVARTAFTLGADTPALAKVRRLIMLGTPNHGSFAPVQAIRATYGLVLTVAKVAQFAKPKQTPQWLAENVFSTFPGLYQLLPTAEKFSSINLFKPESWSATTGRPAPRPDVLKSVAPAQKLFAPGSDRMFLIAGVKIPTTVDMRVGEGGVEYAISSEGDGTVPLQFARLAGVPTYYIEERHSSLPNNSRVARAVSDLLDRGKTDRLPDTWTAPFDPVVWRPEEEVRSRAMLEVEPRPLSQSEVRHLLDEWVAPDARETVQQPIAAGPASVFARELPRYGHQFDHVVVGRRRQHRVDVRLARGSITDVDARAYVIGVFEDVTPSGAARAIDAAMDGALSEMSMRRMFTGRVGEVFMLPAGRNSLRADMIALVGLGSFDRFNQEVQQIAAENVIRTFVRTNVEEFATVLFGTGSGRGPAASLQNLLAGFIRGLTDADRDHRFRRLILAELNDEIYREMKEEFFRLSSTEICRDVEITFDERVYPASPQPPAARGLATSFQPTYLIVREETHVANVTQREEDRPPTVVRSSLLTSGGKAAVISESQILDEEEVESLRAQLRQGQFREEQFEALGTRIGALMLHPSIRSVLGNVRDRHLVIVHDLASARLPWELLCIDGWFPAFGEGLTHRYLAENMSVAKWLEERRQSATIQIMLVVNPTGDLQGAVEEGDRILKLFKNAPNVRIDEYRERDATKPALLAAMRSGKYDVMHYAGHAFFDANRPSNSGILCANRAVLSGADLAGIGNLPALMFFNACESGMLREASPDAIPEPEIPERIAQASGMAEAFLRGGVANYVGTYWPVGDASASEFGVTFYSALLRGESIGNALLLGRKAVRELTSAAKRDWADYIHYGEPTFVLKTRQE